VFCHQFHGFCHVFLLTNYTIVNNPTYGRIISSKKIDDSVKIGNINESSKHPDMHSDLVDQFKKISFKEKKRNNIKLEL
jgi:hypothetical protein